MRSIPPPAAAFTLAVALVLLSPVVPRDAFLSEPQAPEPYEAVAPDATFAADEADERSSSGVETDPTPSAGTSWGEEFAHEAPSRTLSAEHVPGIADALADDGETSAEDAQGSDAVEIRHDPSNVRRELRLDLRTAGFSTSVQVVPHPRLAGSYFVLEQAGVIRALGSNGIEPTPALDLRPDVTSGGESGLHSLAFMPSDPSRAFIVHNDRSGDIVLKEYALRPDGTFDAARALERLRIPAAYGAHHGGALAFGPDGMLYLSVGDGGDQDDPDRRAQDLASWNGKILRIDVSERAAGYAVPTDNPFVRGARPEVWLYGFRNPWRMSFDQATGDLWISDVGGSLAEEIDLHPRGAKAGANFGWGEYEGTYSKRGGSLSSHVLPVHTYMPTGGYCAVVGGLRYHGPIASLEGAYLYSDFCKGGLRALREVDGRWESEHVHDTPRLVVHLAQDKDGSILILTLRGDLHRLDEVLVPIHDERSEPA